MTFAQLRDFLRADRERLEACIADCGEARGWVRCSPAWTCVILHRWSRWLFVRGWTIAARFVWQLNLWITGADIAPMSGLGPGLVILHPFSVTIAGNAGRNLFVGGLGGIGGGMSLEDVGAGPGVPVLGDDVWLERGAMVLGPVRIGDRVRIGAGCTVVRDVGCDCTVDPLPVRVRTGGGA
jgi:serine O-acetyltransferase